MSRKDGAHTHGHGGSVRVTAGGLAFLAAGALVLTHMRQTGQVIGYLVWAVVIILVVLAAGGAVAVVLIRRHYTSGADYAAEIAQPGKMAEMRAEQRHGVDAAHPQQIHGGQHVHLNIAAGVSPETAAAAVRALKEAQAAQPLPRREDEW